MIKKLLTVCIMTMLIGSSAMDVSASTLTYSERVDSDVSSEVGDICEEVSGNLKRNYAERYIVEDFETNIYRAEQSEDKFIVYLFSKFDGMMKEGKLEDCAYVKGVYSALGVECTDKGFEADIKEVSGYSKSAAVEQVSDSLINEMEIYEKYISEYTDFNFFYRIEFDMNNDVIEKENYKVYLDDTDILFEEIMPKSEAELFQQGMERVETLNDTIVAEKTIDLNANAKSIRSNEQKYGMMVSYMTTYTSNPSGCYVCEECDMLQDTSLSTITMEWYDSERDKGVISEEVLTGLPKNHSEVFYYVTDDMEIVLYVEEVLSTAYIIINGQKLLFVEENMDYNLRPDSEPQLLLEDLNGDSVLDIMLSDYCYYSGMVHNTYLSISDGGYKEFGSVVQGGNDAYDYYKGNVVLLDNFKAKVSLDGYGISKVIELDDDFSTVAVELGLYDSEGKLTAYGKEWNPKNYRVPYADEITYWWNDEKQVIVQVKAPIAAGYSSYRLGGGYVFSWKVGADEFELDKIVIYKENS